MSKQKSVYVGLFPAAGHARRLATQLRHMNTSKELTLVPDLHTIGEQIAVGDYLIREYRHAQIQDIIVIRRKEKEDIAQHFDSPDCADLNITDIVTPPTRSTAHSIDQAWPYIDTRPIALGFPDMIIHPPGIFKKLQDELERSSAVACLGLFPALNPTQLDMVAYRGQELEKIVIKPEQTSLTMTWSCAVWAPEFSVFMHEYLAKDQTQEEIYLGKIFQAALDAGMRFRIVAFDNHLSLDIGTPESYARAQALANRES